MISHIPRPSTSEGGTPTSLFDYYQSEIDYLLIGLSLSTRIHQIPIAKDRITETDNMVFERIRNTYYEALNPSRRWSPQWRLWVRIRESVMTKCPLCKRFT